MRTLCLGMLACLALAFLAGCDLFSRQELPYMFWEPALDPEGSLLVYESMTPDGLSLFILDMASGVERQVTFGDAPEWSPQWSPDGTRIVFVSRRGNNVDLYVLAVDTLETVRLTTHEADDVNPHWGSDGLIYFNSNRSGTWGILTIDPETRELGQVTVQDGQP